MALEIRKLGDRKRVKQHVGEHSLTQQNMAAETDINAIMRKYEKTGILTHVSRYAGQYGDFSGVPDYQTGLDMIMAADEMFSSLPARIRDRFNNDPAKFIDFATNEDNIDEMRKMGLAPELPPVVERPTLETEGGNPAPKEPKKTPAKGDQ